MFNLVIPAALCWGEMKIKATIRAWNRHFRAWTATRDPFRQIPQSPPRAHQVPPLGMDRKPSIHPLKFVHQPCLLFLPKRSTVHSVFSCFCRARCYGR